MKEVKNYIKHFVSLIIINNALTYGVYRFCHARVNVCSVINSLETAVYDNRHLCHFRFLLKGRLMESNTDNSSIKYNNSE